MKTDYDLLIIGGGMVGASLACALAPLSLKIGLVERFPFKETGQPAYDDRSIALAWGSMRIFHDMGLSEALMEVVSPIKRIHISERGQFGATRLDSMQMDVDALGYVVESRELGKILHTRLQQASNIEMICPADVQEIRMTEKQALLSIAQDGQITQVSASLVVAADGSQSSVRELLEIPSTTWDYGQTALISNVSTRKHHQQVAYERFTDTGPLALLPMKDLQEGEQTLSRCSLVWTLRNDQVDEYMALSDAEFLQRLQARFGHRLGEFIRVGRRHSFPLKLVRATEYVQARVALIGNAAHTIHPVAGQGYNLGIRDVAALAEVLATAVQAGQDIGDIEVMKHYVEWRKQDHRRVIAFTDGLARIFSNPLFPVKKLRSAALTLLDVIPPFKNALARRTMGLSGRRANLP